MEEFAELREDWLRKWLKLPNGVPCANTFSHVLQAIEPTAIAACIAGHVARRMGLRDANAVISSLLFPLVF